MIDKDGNRILKADGTPATEEELRKAAATRRWRVRYSNYDPPEIDSTWPTDEQAEARADELNERDGTGMWDVEEVTTP